MSGSFDESFPTLTRWVMNHGLLEIGDDGFTRSLIRVLDEGGMIWEGAERYESADAALRAAEEGLRRAKDELGID